MTVLIAMPSPHPITHHSWEECVIGTKGVMYKSDLDHEPEESDSEPEKDQPEYPSHSSVMDFYGGMVSYYIF
jgi:hypothetical protein